MKDEELSEALRELRDADEIPPAAYAAVRARVMTTVAAERRRAWPWWLAATAAAAACVLWMLVLRMAPVPAPPRVAQVKPVVIAVPAEPPPVPQRVRVHRNKPKPIQPAGPLVIKMLTDDPDVVIYWMVDQKGE